jgi:hypothetical protein
MSSRYTSVIVGLFAGLATALFAVIAVTGGSPGREPDPKFDVDLYATPTLSPTSQVTGTQSEPDPIGRLIQRLEALRESIPSPASPDAPLTPVPSEAQQDPSPGPSEDGCVMQRSEQGGVSRTSVRCEYRVVTEDGSGSVSISSTSDTSVSSTSPDSQ